MFFFAGPKPVRMDTINALLTSLGDLLLAPFRSRPATGLVFWSAVSGVCMAYVTGKTSNQRALRQAADNIRAQLFAIKLFKEDLVVTLRCQISLLKSTGQRLWHSLPPMLVLAGGAAPEAHQWLDRLSRPPLASHVQYRGYTSDQDRERLFAGARALVLPSLDEGFGLPALEAMAAGVPVVASNRGALPEVVAAGGTLLDPTDVEGWVSAIERLARDDRWAAEQGCAGLERAKAFTWPATAKRVREAYVDAVARRAGR